MKKVIVRYKEIRDSGLEVPAEKEFMSWEEEGSYTMFSVDESLEGVSLIIPTRLVLSIKLVKETNQ